MRRTYASSAMSAHSEVDAGAPSISPWAHRFPTPPGATCFHRCVTAMISGLTPRRVVAARVIAPHHFAHPQPPTSAQSLRTKQSGPRSAGGTPPKSSPPTKYHRVRILITDFLQFFRRTCARLRTRVHCARPCKYDFRGRIRRAARRVATSMPSSGRPFSPQLK